jgi:hypothetical protein
MNTYAHLLIRLGLLKNCAANAAHGNAVLAVGLRAETLLQRFLLATTASSVFSATR